MKHFLFWGLILLISASCSHKNTVKIKGEILNADKQSIYLDRINVDNIMTVDSSKIGSKGRFSFKTEVEEPTFYTLRIGQKNTITLLAEPEKEIYITADLNTLGENYRIEGSEGSLWIKQLTHQLHQTQVKLDSLRKSYASLPAGEKFNGERSLLEAEWDSTLVKQLRFSRNFIIQHAVSPASYFALYQKIDNTNFVLSPETELQSYRIVATSMSALYPESQYTKALLAHHEQIVKQQKEQKIRDLIVNAENNLPAINLPDVKGDSVALSSLRGKYILLDFTVLSADGSEAYIQELKKIYHKFKGQGLEIYQVCLDPNKLLWEQLVRKFDIKWVCVRDGGGLKSNAAAIWNVQNIPANYIINKKYEISGKNLAGKRLEERLKDVIK